MFGGHGAIRYLQYCYAAIPIICLFSLKKYKTAFRYSVLFILCALYPGFILPHIPGICGVILGIISAVFYQVIPGMSMFVFILLTTTVSEFTAAMDRMNIPKAISVPVSVMFRFFPAIKEEYGYIRDAMKMRGISGTSSPQLFLEYRLVPLMTAILNIGSDLSASALSRGLDSPKKRTSACEIGFGTVDKIIIIFCILSLVFYIFSKAAGI